MTLQETLVALAAEAGLDRTAASLLWAAFDGDDALVRALDGDHVEPPATGTAARTVPVWLSSVSVAGFRGIGPEAELLLNPKPGLTLVVGRNGSGKSSFAEGLEALLTGDNLRWRDRPPAWREGWRNLHHGGQVELRGEFQREGDTKVTELTRRWGEQFEESTVACRRDGTTVGFEGLGWDEALTNYKPFLSYNELGSMLEQKPSAIYDSMAGVLGLDRLTDARNRLRQARLEAEKPAKEVAKTKKDLRRALAESDAERAAEAVDVLKARTVDLDRLEALAFGGDAGHDPLGELAQLTPLDAERCEALAKGLGEAMDTRHRLAATDAATSGRVAGLLRMAIEHHRHEGDGACPVCGVGTLDHGWRTEAEREADQLERASSALQDAERRVTAARQDALVVFVQPPSALSAQIDAIDGADINRDQRAVRNRWEEWIDPPADGWTDVDIVARLRDVADMNIVIDGIRAVAAEAVAAQEADWRPLARQLSAWVVAARDAAEATARAKRVGVVEDFYKDAEATIRAQRFQPIADRSAQLWAGLRQQSNVKLERVALEGRTTQRRVELDVTVDGTATSALGVMSQGELHALALALFLPRVTAGESPFRFLVVDDPVQAMDPARVDGLARVLESVAVERQVIVFTHDDRLPASCRRLGVRAEIIEISRQPGSRVTASAAAGPAEKAIGDAYALATTERLPDSLKRQIVPIHCRRALEAQVQDLVWRQLLAAGRGHDEIDELITDADTTAALIALLLFGEQRPPDEVYGRLDLLRSGAGSQVRFLNRAVHEAPGDLRPEVLTGTIRNLMATLRDSARGNSVA